MYIDHTLYAQQLVCACMYNCVYHLCKYKKMCTIAQMPRSGRPTKINNFVIQNEKCKTVMKPQQCSYVNFYCNVVSAYLYVLCFEAVGHWAGLFEVLLTVSLTNRKGFSEHKNICMMIFKSYLEI